MSAIESDEFATRYDDLSDDEQEVLSEMLKRIEMGRDQYGPLDIDNDPRNFRQEAAEEWVDLAVYSIADAIRKRRR